MSRFALIAIVLTAALVSASSLITVLTLTTPQPRVTRPADEQPDRGILKRAAAGVICWNDGKPC